jgi:hypothetical protein
MMKNHQNLIFYRLGNHKQASLSSARTLLVDNHQYDKTFGFANHL